MTGPEPLRLGPATELAHALASRIAEVARVRVVFIKGSVADGHALREARNSSDVDVMVDPSRTDDYVRALGEAGWSERPTSFAQSAFATHSRSFLHPDWPCDIDVHSTFPGFLAPPQDCFEALWEGRATAEVAGRPIPGAGLIASILIGGLHALRSPESLRHRQELDTLVAWCADELDDDRLAELAAFSHEFQAFEPARPFLELLGLRPPPTRVPVRQLAQWRLLSQQANRSGSWLAAIHAAPLSKKPGLLFRALFPSRDDLVIEWPGLGSSPWELFRVRMRRLGRALRALPRAMNEFRVHRESITADTAPVARQRPAADRPPSPAREEHDQSVPSSAERSAPQPEEGAGRSAGSPGDEPPRAGRLSRGPLVAYTPADVEGLFVLDLTRVRDARPVHLNGPASAVWELLEQPTTEEQLADELAGLFGAPADTIRADLEGLITAMRTHGILDRAEDGPEPGPGPANALSVTCVIPTHNRDDSMLGALESVRGQTHAAERIVVVDDIGSDGTRAAVEAVSAVDARVEYRDAHDLPHKAAGASRNAGAARAGSDLLAFLDDDDTWDEHFLEAAIAELERSGADLVVTWGSLRRGETVMEHNWKAETGATADEILTANPGVTGSNFVVRRAAFESIGGFDARLWVYNDLDFFVRFLDAGHSYSVVRRDLVRQVSTGGDHLSSRSERRARGIEAYLAKYEHRLSIRQRRSLIRSIHLARLFRDQTRGRRIVHLAGAIANSSTSDSVGAVRRRLTKAPSYN